MQNNEYFSDAYDDFTGVEGESNNEDTIAIPFEKTERERDCEILQSLSDPIKRILSQIESQVATGKYQLIIGDDASGRLPALLLGGVIRDIARKYAMQIPEMRFVAGTRGYNRNMDKNKKAKLNAYLEELKKSIPSLQNVLVVTDIIETGASLEPLTRSIFEAGLSCEVASMIVTADDFDRTRERIGAEIISGEGGGEVYGKTSLSGVKKDREDLHARRYIDTEKLYGDELLVQRRINNVRQEINKLVVELSDWFVINTDAPRGRHTIESRASR